jgi:signal transduction histidine kinase
MTDFKITKINKKLPLLIYAGCGFSLLLVIMVGVTSLYFSNRQKQKELWVEHTYQVLEKVHAVYYHLYEMGMDKQRYRSTGVNDFFQSYHNHSDSLLTELIALNNLSLDNPAQVIKIVHLRQQISNLIKFWHDEGINLKNADAKSVLEVTWTEKLKLDSIRLEIAAVSETERSLLKEREDGNGRLTAITEFTILTGTFLILILVCILIYFILQELKNRINAWQKEKEMNQLKSNFVSLASHEFRTPLSSILLSVSLIEKYIKSQDTANVAKHSQKIKTAVNNLKAILEDFLSLEKLDAGKIKAVFQHFDLIELCEEITDEMKMIAGPDQTLRFDHTGTDKIVNLDKNLVRNSIINLVSNSVKYAGEHADILLKADISASGIVITVIDNGTGIPEEDQKELFSPFFRINHTGKIPGTGLGLNIVSRYVHLMNGKITFSSIPNEETTFKMSFPINNN